ncbi:MAG: hypothetical protein JWM78_740 [Verrucomicrobiaceae bacterium]|nr:hypothetical protein [Verrucomicrobiaceae bacterium]
MDTPLYDVYLTGKLAENATPAQAAQRLAALFKSTPDAMTGMLTGKPHLLKRGIDKNTALKYREALASAGVEVAFKAQASAPTTTLVPAQTATVAEASQLSLAPAGTDLLKPDERRQIVASVIDTTTLQLAPQSPLPAVEAAHVIAPDVSGLSLAAAGGELLSAQEREQPPIAIPDVSDLTLAPAGTILETLHESVEPVEPDISALSLAPAGTELLTPEQRETAAPPAPNTDHLTLAN